MKHPDEYVENISTSIEQISKIKDKIIEYREFKNGLKGCKLIAKLISSYLKNCKKILQNLWTKKEKEYQLMNLDPNKRKQNKNTKQFGKIMKRSLTI